MPRSFGCVSGASLFSMAANYVMFHSVQYTAVKKNILSFIVSLFIIMLAQINAGELLFKLTVHY